MKRSEAKALAWNLRHEGKDLETIAKILGEKGVVSRRGGTPLTKAGVYSLMGNLGVKKSRRKKPKAQSPKPKAQSPKPQHDSQVTLIRSICEQERLSPEDRIAAILLLTH